MPADNNFAASAETTGREITIRNKELKTAIEISPRPVSFGAAFRFWIEHGFSAFGGPAGQTAVIHNELIDKRLWLSDGRWSLAWC
jgi:hypothetical protein